MRWASDWDASVGAGHDRPLPGTHSIARDPSGTTRDEFDRSRSIRDESIVAIRDGDEIDRSRSEIMWRHAIRGTFYAAARSSLMVASVTRAVQVRKTSPSSRVAR